MQNVGLTRRMAAVAGLVPPCGCIADVGCDHGKLGLHLLLTGRCHALIATEISEPSLEKARRLFQRYGVSDRTQCLLHDGLPTRGMAQAAVIAGIGALNILDILKRGEASAAGMKRIVLQPSTGAAALREGLGDLGFVIDEETIVYEQRYFPVLAVHRDGKQRPMDVLACEIGPCNMEHPDGTVLGCVDWRLRVLKKAVRTPAKTKKGRQNQQAVMDVIAALTQWRKEHAHATDT